MYNNTYLYIFNSILIYLFCLRVLQFFPGRHTKQYIIWKDQVIYVEKSKVIKQFYRIAINKIYIRYEKPKLWII